MANINYLRRATYEDVEKLRHRIRKEDNDETLASCGAEASIALKYSFLCSELCWVVVHNGVVSAMLGVSPDTSGDGKGSPWLLASDDFANLNKYILRHCRTFIGIMWEEFNYLENWVDDRNETSKRWLKWCGFTIEEPEPYGVEGRLFRRFWTKEKPCAHQQS